MTILKPYHQQIQRLKRYFSRPEKGGFIFAVTEDERIIPAVNKEIIDQASKPESKIGVIFLNRELDLPILAQIREAAQKYPGGVIVSNLSLLILDDERQKKGYETITEINFNRETLTSLGVLVLFWLSADLLPVVQMHARDLYSQREVGTLFFEGKVDSDEYDSGIELSLLSESENESSLLNSESLLEQLSRAEKGGLSPERIAAEIVLPLVNLLVIEEDNRTEPILDKYLPFIDLENPQNATQYSQILMGQGNYSEAIKYLEKAISVYADKGNTYLESEKWFMLGRIYEEKGIWQMAHDAFKKSIHIIKDNEVEAAERKMLLSMAYGHLGNCELLAGATQYTLAYFQMAAIFAREIFETNPENLAAKRRYGATNINFGSAFAMLGNITAGISIIEQGQKILREILIIDPSNYLSRQELGRSCFLLGSLYGTLSNWEKAVTEAEHAMKIYKELIFEHPGKKTVRFEYAQILKGIGELYENANQIHMAKQKWDMLLELIEFWPFEHREESKVSELKKYAEDKLKAIENQAI